MSTTLLASMVATSTLFACLSEIESGHDDHKVGRAGEVSRYQIRPEVWRYHSSLPIACAVVRTHARHVVTQAQLKRVAAFVVIWAREPTVREWYVLWNAPTQAYRGRPSKVVAARAQRFANLVEAEMAKQKAQVKP